MNDALIDGRKTSTDVSLEALSAEFLTPVQLAALTHLSVATIRTNASRTPNRLPPITRIGAHLLFRRVHVEAWLDSLAAVPTTTSAIAHVTAPAPAPRRRPGRPLKGSKRTV